MSVWYAGLLLWTVAIAAEDDRRQEFAGPDAGYRITKQLSTETHRNFKPLFHLHKKNHCWIF